MDVTSGVVMKRTDVTPDVGDVEDGCNFWCGDEEDGCNS